MRNARKLKTGIILRKLESMDLSVNAFAQKYGFTQQAMQGWLNNKYNPKMTSLRKLAEAFKCEIDDISYDVNASTIIDNTDDPMVQEALNKHALHTTDGKFASVPVISSAAAAEVNSVIMPLAEYVNANTEEFQTFENTKPGDFGIRVEGESMMPWYPPGTVLLVRANQYLKNGDRVVAVLQDGDIIFKTFAKSETEYMLFSINDNGRDYRFALNDTRPIRAIYKVIASMRDELKIDEAMNRNGITHGWQKKLEAIKESENNK